MVKLSFKEMSREKVLKYLIDKAIKPNVKEVNEKGTDTFVF
jgi:hypothetical protein